MTTRTRPRLDTDSMLQAGADAIASALGATSKITISTVTTIDAITTRAVVVDGTTTVLGLGISPESALTLSGAVQSDAETDPDEATLAGMVDALATQFFDAVGTLVGEEPMEVEPEPFETIWNITVGSAVIEVGVVSIPIVPAVPSTAGSGRLSGVRLDVSVELGRARIPVKELLALDEGGVIRLGRPVGEPVDLVVNGTVTARGEIVVVDGRLGLRITSLV